MVVTGCTSWFKHERPAKPAIRSDGRKRPLELALPCRAPAKMMLSIVLHGPADTPLHLIFVRLYERGQYISTT